MHADHVLYTDADSFKPEAILDRNGQVALACCKKCGKGEAELTEPCVPVVNEVIVTASHIVCPHCSEEVDGWLNDPRGVEETCDYCHKPFKVNDDADLEIR